jgi:hypothetical protein
VSGQPRVHVDRLILTAGTMTEAQGRRLAELVGKELLWLPTCAPGWKERVEVSIPSREGQTLEATARAVVAEIAAILRADGAA